MKTALYHQHGQSPLELEIISEGKGLLDLGRDGQVLVAACQISDEPKPGFATLKGKKGKKDKAAKSEAKPEGDDEEDEEEEEEGGKPPAPPAGGASAPAGIGIPNK